VIRRALLAVGGALALGLPLFFGGPGPGPVPYQGVSPIVVAGVQISCPTCSTGGGGGGGGASSLVYTTVGSPARARIVASLDNLGELGFSVAATQSPAPDDNQIVYGINTTAGGGAFFGVVASGQSLFLNDNQFTVTAPFRPISLDEPISTPTPGIPWIGTTDGNDIANNLNAGGWNLYEHNTLVYQVNDAGVVEFQATGAPGASDFGIGANTSGISYQVPSTKDHEFWVNTTEPLDITGSQVTAVVPVQAPQVIFPPGSNTGTGAVTINWATSAMQTLAVDSNSTISFSGAVSGETLVVRATNANNYTLAWPTVDWGGSLVPVLTTGGGTDVFSILDFGGTFYGSVVQNVGASGGTLPNGPAFGFFNSTFSGAGSLAVGIYTPTSSGHLGYLTCVAAANGTTPGSWAVTVKNLSTSATSTLTCECTNITPPNSCVANMASVGSATVVAGESLELSVTADSCNTDPANVACTLGLTP
jgi:hypothetical protein